MKKTLNYIPIVMLGFSSPLFSDEAPSEKDTTAEKEMTDTKTEEKETSSEEEVEMSIVDIALANEDPFYSRHRCKSRGISGSTERGWSYYSFCPHQRSL